MIKIVPTGVFLSDETVYFNFSGLFGDGKGNNSPLNLEWYFETVHFLFEESGSIRKCCKKT